jgi:hypothetical protein
MVKCFRFIFVSYDYISEYDGSDVCDSFFSYYHERYQNVKSSLACGPTVRQLANNLNFIEYNVIFLPTKRTLSYYQYIIH